MLDQLSTLLSERFIEFLGLCLTVLSGWGVTRFAVWLKTKTSIELNESQERRLRELVDEAVDTAEEWAHRERKSGRTPLDTEKLDVALMKLKRRAGLEKLEHKVDNGTAADQIHSELGRHRSFAPPPPGD